MWGGFGRWSELLLNAIRWSPTRHALPERVAFRRPSFSSWELFLHGVMFPKLSSAYLYVLAL
jgi:hypothetical protein